MPSIAVYNMTGDKVGEIELCDSIFGIKPNKDAMYTLVRQHLANLRQGTQSTLTRAEVAGGGRKPWRQKGTGRARQGSTRSPQWTHGGIAFGPKPRDFSYTVNKKLRRLAIKSALSAKAASGDIIVVENLNLPEIKTKSFKSFLSAVKADGKTLVITPESRENIYKSARNIQGVKTTVANVLSVYDMLKCDKFIIDRDAIARIEEVYP